MATKHKRIIPTVWLLTDERLGGTAADDPLWRAIDSLPRGAGIVLRHYRLPMAERRALCARIGKIAKRRHLLLVASGFPGPDGRHYPAFSRRGPQQAAGLVTASAHGWPHLLAAARAGADLVFLSPAFATRSHPGAPVLGPLRFGLTARRSPVPVVALGGMTPQRQQRLRPLGAAGFAAIDWWLTAQPVGGQSHPPR